MVQNDIVSATEGERETAGEIKEDISAWETENELQKKETELAAERGSVGDGARHRLSYRERRSAVY
jgi:hypothetical protein